MTEPTTPAARPRPAATQERDQAVLTFLQGQRGEDGAYAGVSRDAIATELGVDGKAVYLSLWRLKRDGKVTKGGAGGSQKWTAVDAPAEQPA